MLKKIAILTLTLFILMNCVVGVDSSNWSTVNVGYEEFRIPPQYENPYSSDFDMYEFDEDIDEFTIRYVNPRIMELYGYFIDNNQFKKVNVGGHDAVHFTKYDRHDEKNNSKLWFSAGEEFYYITWRGENITPTIEEIVKNVSPSNFTKKEFYSILDEEYKNYQLIHAIESQRNDYPSGRDSGHTFFSIGTNGFSVGRMY